MNTILFFGVDADLSDGQESGKHGMIGEEDVIKINFSCLGIIDEVSVSVVDTVEQEAGEVHGNEIEVHAFDTE